MDNPNPMKIGLFGGSFNPPHMAHVLVAAWALATGEIEQIWVLPTGGHPFGKWLAPFEDRMEMCRRAFRCFGERVQIMDIESEERVHYSIETVRELRRHWPEHHWRWLMGSDTLEDALKWREFEELMQLAPALIVPRAGHTEAWEEGSNLEFALPDLSSTYLRRELAEGKADQLGHLLPRPVLEWILGKGLYIPETPAPRENATLHEP